jgi:hypothetical protein
MKTVRCVGLDVHKDSIAVAVADPEGGAPSRVATILNDTRLLLQKLKKAGSGKKVIAQEKLAARAIRFADERRSCAVW